MNKFDIEKTTIPGLLTIQPKPIRDDRGWFTRTFAAQELAGYGIDHTTLVEANHSRSHRGVIRGLHTRMDAQEAKLVRVPRGRIFDVVVDLRPTSPAFGSWLGFELDDEEQRQLFIPAGCAHGFQALSDVVDVCYRVSAPYDPSLDAAVAWDDPEIGVRWPLSEATVSVRDRSAPRLADIRPQLDRWFGQQMWPEPMPSHLFDGVYAGRRVLVTGHTGFLGGWTTRWLAALGAEVAGYSRGGAREDDPVSPTAVDYRGDIGDRVRVAEAIDRFAPEMIIHLAGSTTVAAGFRSPLDTFTANVIGTCAVLDAALRQPATRAVVIAGTPAVVNLDDVLECNPYPASKLAVEAVAGAYAHPRTQDGVRHSHPLAVGVARPGVMVGGDWGEGRLLADVVRQVRAGQPVVLRSPYAVRPWQHVLEGVGGALLLGARLYDGSPPRRRYDFGRPDPHTAEPVREVVTRFLAALGLPDWPVRIEGDGGDRVELGAAAAGADLGWTPVWDLDQTLRAAAGWYTATGPEAVGFDMDRTLRRYAHDCAAAWRGDRARI